MNISKILEFIKLSPKYLLPISLVTGFLLLGKEEYTQKLGLDAFTSSYKHWIGIIFLLSSALFICDIVYKIWYLTFRKFKNWRFINYGQKRLANLTNEEKEILRGFIFQQTRTQKLSVMSGVVKSLEHENIIYQSSNLGRLFEGFAYNIQPWAWEYLNKNKELLE